MATQFVLPRQVKINLAGRPYAGATAQFFQSGTDVPQTVYQDSARTTPHPAVIPADDDGYFPPIWLDHEAEADYRVLILSATGSLLDDESGIQRKPISYTSNELSATLDSLALTIAEQAVGVTPVNFAYEPGNFRRYGAVADGIADDSGAIRKALNSVPAEGGRVFCWPPGKIKVASVVYIPQREQTGHGIDIDLTGCTLIGAGQGVGGIFESGTGTLSSATNFGQPNETASSIHQHARIHGGTLAKTGTAIRLFNWLKGCVVENVFFQEVDTSLYTLRSFYLQVDKLAAVVTAIPTGKILFNFDGLCNAMRVTNCTAAGGGTNTTGIGFQFLIGGGIVFQGNTAEGMDTGLKLAATVQGLDIGSCYFEGCATAAIDASGAGTKQMDIHDSFFNGVTKAVTASQWISGTWSGSNVLVTGDIVEILDTASFCTIEIPGMSFSESGTTNTTPSVPSNYHLTNSVPVRAPRLIYAAAAGPSQPIVVDQGSVYAPSFAYSGGPAGNGSGYWLPFASQANAVSSSTIDTQINWSDYRMEVVFDLEGDIGGGGSIRLYGFVFSTGNIFRCDGSSATWSVTATSNAGKLRLTVGGSALSGKTMLGWQGQIRHV